MTDIEKAREFLSELNSLIEKTSFTVLRQAQTNLQVRLHRATEAGEDTGLWYRVIDVVSACERAKRILQ